MPLAAAVVLTGLAAAILIISSANLRGDSTGGDYVALIQMGLGAEDENDAMIMAALGKDGDIAKDVVKATDEAVAKATNETSQAVSDEISAALDAGAKAGQGAFWETKEEARAHCTNRNASCFSLTPRQCSQGGSEVESQRKFQLRQQRGGRHRVHQRRDAQAVINMLARNAAAWEADIAKYKGQEAGMGHKGWIQSWANHERTEGLKQQWRRAPLQQVSNPRTPHLNPALPASTPTAVSMFRAAGPIAAG